MFAHRTNHLDRLSALLEGLRPRIVWQPADEPAASAFSTGEAARLDIYLFTGGTLDIAMADDAHAVYPPPALLVGRAGGRLPETLARRAAGGRALRLAVTLEGPAGALLADEFPEPAAFSVPRDDTALAQIIRLIEAELASPRCGHPALLERAGDILFIGILRYLVEHPGRENQLFRGLADRRIARALVAMHGAPQQPWSLEGLAAEAGMSRTAFANAFRQLLRQTPGRYLAGLRLAIAGRAIRTGSGLKQAAQAAGYASPAALSRALSRTARQGASAA